MKFDWVDINRYNKDNPLPDADYYHCDTRDFHILSNDGLGTIGLEETLKKAKPDTLVRREDIVPYLLSIKEGLDKKASWRHLVFDGKDIPRVWFKYIRFWRVPDKKDLYLMYYSSGSTLLAMDPAEYTPEAVDLS